MESLYKRLKFAFSFLKNPERHFSSIDNEILDSILGNYVILLLFCSLMAGFSLFILNVLKALYLSQFFHADVSYLGVLNYSFGMGTSTAFFYLFIGTFGIFFLLLFMKLITKKNFVKITKITLYSMTPILVFGWIPFIGSSTIIWSLFLLLSGIISNKRQT